MPTPSVASVPDLLTVEEAARVLRIGRTAAYQLAQKDLANGGSEGLHVVRVGRMLRVPRVAIEALTGVELTAELLCARQATDAEDSAVAHVTEVRSIHASRSAGPAATKARSVGSNTATHQLDLFDSIA